MTCATVAQQHDRGTHLMPVPSVHDRDLVAALRAGNEWAFTALVERYHPTMLRLARNYTPDDAVAQEVVQETWLSVLLGLPRFEGRSALKTWIFRILVNIARTRGQREHRTIAFSLAGRHDVADGNPAAGADRFGDDGNVGASLASEEDLPEEHLLAAEMHAYIRAAVEQLPPRQRMVITLRDIDDRPADEVCKLLEIAPTHQRVLLHRARSSVRRALEPHLVETSPLRSLAAS